MKKFLTVIMLMMFGFAMLGACGKMSDPVPVEGSGYPHSYPRR